MNNVTIRVFKTKHSNGNRISSRFDCHLSISSLKQKRWHFSFFDFFRHGASRRKQNRNIQISHSRPESGPPKFPIPQDPRRPQAKSYCSGLPLPAAVPAAQISNSTRHSGTANQIVPFKSPTPSPSPSSFRSPKQSEDENNILRSSSNTAKMKIIYYCHLHFVGR